MPAASALRRASSAASVAAASAEPGERGSDAGQAPALLVERVREPGQGPCGPGQAGAVAERAYGQVSGARIADTSARAYAAAAPPRAAPCVARSVARSARAWPSSRPSRVIWASTSALPERARAGRVAAGARRSSMPPAAARNEREARSRRRSGRRCGSWHASWPRPERRTTACAQSVDEPEQCGGAASPAGGRPRSGPR
jgi:hypothetical protein